MNKFISVLQVLNFCIVQWLGVRVFVQYSIEDEKKKYVGIGILGPVLPLTGWWNWYKGWPNNKLVYIGEESDE